MQRKLGLNNLLCSFSSCDLLVLQALRWTSMFGAIRSVRVQLHVQSWMSVTFSVQVVISARAPQQCNESGLPDAQTKSPS